MLQQGEAKALFPEPVRPANAYPCVLLIEFELSDRQVIPPRVAVLQILLCAVWGLGQIATKVGLEGISPLFQAGLRSFGATLLILLWISVRKIPMRWRDGSIWLGLAIGVVFALEFICLYLGLVYTGAARATLLLYTAPFFVAFGAHWLVPNDKLTRLKLLGLLLAFAGVLLAFSDRLGMPNPQALIGDALCLAAGFFWAVTTLMVKATRLQSVVPEKNLLYQLAVSSVLLVLGALLLDEPGIFNATPRVALAFAYQTLVIAAISYLTWFFLIQRFRASALASFTFLTPVFGVVCAWLLLGEPITLAILAAMLLIAAGIVLVNRAS
jgi:drug/metabolite transporter (DMT)-like permease